ncbi:MAG: hypothetical protein F6K09_21040 [Merismopedia sp. SIO2A8]|nr:hypothetical protein [Merismopedia sp. SIO2A8]
MDCSGAIAHPPKELWQTLEWCVTLLTLRGLRQCFSWIPFVGYTALYRIAHSK